jgi:hypothetical protein
MKTRLTIIALALITAASFGFSKEPAKKFATIEQRIKLGTMNYAVGLESDNDGLVESCIKMIAKMKLQVPTADVTDLQETLDEMSVSHPSPTVRYKAYIASSICSDPAWFTQMQDADNDSEFFIHAANRLQEKLFGLNSL